MEKTGECFRMDEDGSVILCVSYVDENGIVTTQEFLEGDQNGN